MKGLRKFLTPFAPDQSGAVSVLYELGGIIVVCDAGGCTGNICGFDEPRWFKNRSAVFSAGLRDMDAILGRDDKLVEKLADAVNNIDAKFAAIIGTPVPAVIGTDFKALQRLAEKKVGVPVLAIPTTGLNLYDAGAEIAYKELFKKFAEDNPEKREKSLGVIGAIPLDMSDTRKSEMLSAKLKECGWEEVLTYGLNSNLEDIKKAGGTEKNLVVSPSGLKAAKYLCERFGTPYEVYNPLYEDLITMKDYDDKNVLVVHQQVIANCVREEVLKRGANSVQVASWFMIKKELSQPGDIHLIEEDDFEKLVYEGNYDLIIADESLKRIIPEYKGEFVHAPQFAVSGKL